MIVLFCLLTLLSSTSAEQNSKHSPLDYGRPIGLSSLPYKDPTKEYEVNSPPCESACMEPSLKVISHFFEPGNIRDNMITVCRLYDEAITCHQRFTQCDRSMFETVTSGVQYMCKDQRHAFDVLIDCIDNNTQLVTKDCDALCQPNNLVAGLALKDTVMDSLQQPLISQGLNMRDMIEPHLGKLFFSEGCRVTDCLMNCYKTKYNMLCEGTAGSLLMEALVRPLSSETAPDASKFLSAVLGGLLPNSCQYLYAKNGGLRINPELNEEIRRMYKERKPITQKHFEETLSVPSSDKDPFKEITENFLRMSPMEVQKGSFFGSSIDKKPEVEVTKDAEFRSSIDPEVLLLQLENEEVVDLTSTEIYEIIMDTKRNGTVACYFSGSNSLEGSGTIY